MALDLTNGRTRAQSRRRVRVRAPTLTLAAAAAVEVLVVGLALYILLDWPARFLSIVVAALVPLAATLVLGWSRSVDAIAARLVRPATSLAGLTTLIAGVYVFVVVGLGRPPTHGQRTLLALSLAAAGICALLYGPTRRRLDTLAVRLVHGERRRRTQWCVPSAHGSPVQSRSRSSCCSSWRSCARVSGSRLRRSGRSGTAHSSGSCRIPNAGRRRSASADPSCRLSRVRESSAKVRSRSGCPTCSPIVKGSLFASLRSCTVESCSG